MINAQITKKFSIRLAIEGRFGRRISTSIKRQLELYLPLVLPPHALVIGTLRWVG